ncbi:MAG: hypothetical protein NUV52_03660 [Candidatus Roizmanbacteria bacterium]|nr:hypothetical protein [Candidatus Roizmanbacteria bacterium]
MAKPEFSVIAAEAQGLNRKQRDRYERDIMTTASTSAAGYLDVLRQAAALVRDKQPGAHFAEKILVRLQDPHRVLSRGETPLSHEDMMALSRHMVEYPEGGLSHAHAIVAAYQDKPVEAFYHRKPSLDELARLTIDAKEAYLLFAHLALHRIRMDKNAAQVPHLEQFQETFGKLMKLEFSRQYITGPASSDPLSLDINGILFFISNYMPDTALRDKAFGLLQMEMGDQYVNGLFSSKEDLLRIQQQVQKHNLAARHLLTQAYPEVEQQPNPPTKQLFIDMEDRQKQFFAGNKRWDMVEVAFEEDLLRREIFALQLTTHLSQAERGVYADFGQENEQHIPVHIMYQPVPGDRGLVLRWREVGNIMNNPLLTDEGRAAAIRRSVLNSIHDLRNKRKDDPQQGLKTHEEINAIFDFGTARLTEEEFKQERDSKREQALGGIFAFCQRGDRVVIQSKEAPYLWNLGIDSITFFRTEDNLLRVDIEQLGAITQCSLNQQGEVMVPEEVSEHTRKALELIVLTHAADLRQGMAHEISDTPPQNRIREYRESPTVAPAPSETEGISRRAHLRVQRLGYKARIDEATKARVEESFGVPLEDLNLHFMEAQDQYGYEDRLESPIREIVTTLMGRIAEPVRAMRERHPEVDPRSYTPLLQEVGFVEEAFSRGSDPIQVRCPEAARELNRLLNPQR